MNGIIFDLKRGSIKDGPGIRTSVFLKGCPLACIWCHNPESQSFSVERVVTTGESCGRCVSVEEVMDEVRRDKSFYGEKGGLTLTGGEPTAQPQFALALAEAARREGVSVAVDTCGEAPWHVFETLADSVDLFLYDIKAVNADVHRKLTGIGNERILENLRRLDARGVRLWIRMPLVGGVNDSDDELKALRELTDGLRHVERREICPYHSLGLEKYVRFGRKAPFPRKKDASQEEIARWKKFLFDRSKQ